MPSTNSSYLVTLKSISFPSKIITSFSKINSNSMRARYQVHYLVRVIGCETHGYHRSKINLPLEHFTENLAHVCVSKKNIQFQLRPTSQVRRMYFFWRNTARGGRYLDFVTTCVKCLVTTFKFT